MHDDKNFRIYTFFDMSDMEIPNTCNMKRYGRKTRNMTEVLLEVSAWQIDVKNCSYTIKFYY